MGKADWLRNHQIKRHSSFWSRAGQQHHWSDPTLYLAVSVGTAHTWAQHLHHHPQGWQGIPNAALFPSHCGNKYWGLHRHTCLYNQDPYWNHSRDNHHLAAKDRYSRYSERYPDPSKQPNITVLSGKQLQPLTGQTRQNLCVPRLASLTSMCITCVKGGRHRWNALVAALHHSAAALFITPTHAPGKGWNHYLSGTLSTGAHSWDTQPIQEGAYWEKAAVGPTQYCQTAVLLHRVLWA